MTGRDVSDEPRVPKGSGDTSGQWTTRGGAPIVRRSSKSIASVRNGIVTIPREDGTVEMRQGGSRAWRNNNPGNIEAGDRADEAGAIGGDGRFAIFPDEATGQAALEANIDRLSSMTIDNAVKTRSPSNGNDTAHLQSMVRAISGLPGNAVIGKLNPEEKQRLYNAIPRTEGWKPGIALRGVP